jgi:hypothetical protein
VIKEANFHYCTQPYEHEKASYAYLVSIVSFVVGLPLPIMNLIATVGYYLGIRKSSYFVRWHGVQAIITQLFILPFNSVAFWWFISLYISEDIPNATFWLYLLFVLMLNITELILSIITADRVRNGYHVRWWIYASITDALVSDTTTQTPAH